MEKWLKIVSFTGPYEVSNLGRVKNIISGKILTPVKCGKYLRVVLSDSGTIKGFYIHRLMMEAFIPNPNNLPCVNHKDENTTNNYIHINPDGTVNQELSNLEWCDYSYNNRYNGKAKRVGVKRSIGVCQYSLNGEFIRDWVGFREIERTLGFNAALINKVCQDNQRHKTAYGYIWRYK